MYKARHRRLNRLVALKMILAGASADPRVVQPLPVRGRGARAGPAPASRSGVRGGHLRGAEPRTDPVPRDGTAGGRVAQPQAPGGERGDRPRLTPREAAELLEGIARAVHAAHIQGVVHRDLKPGNILFASADFGTPNPDLKTGTGDKHTVAASGARAPRCTPNFALPKVTDFGLAKFTQDSGRT
ncbi:hypothetical protein J8F10_22655 [Gemmata sp. G18]|uniref:Protein kinase domain-containing protein n=1 Tax=Gemmata palustris TaxID=2822762 RepID=A0ABS5BWI3_9BACT|nr:hypothetical protein [Gemmata palustris]MBP3958064.1 hypothetical protein [Gemmata palustris]